MIIGSPQYISPEQGKGEAADDRSDIYSLAVVVYEMFTGHIPFAGDTPYTTILSHINDPLPPPRQFNAKVQPAVEQVLVKALAKDREQRFRNVREFIRALENAVRGPVEENEPAAPILIAESRPIASNPISDIANRLREVMEKREPPMFIIAVSHCSASCSHAFLAPGTWLHRTPPSLQCSEDGLLPPLEFYLS
jgi:serine/threonine protein kinase